MSEIGWILLLVVVLRALGYLVPFCAMSIWKAFNELPVAPEEYLAMKATLKTISPQEEFAKYARLQRKINKEADQLALKGAEYYARRSTVRTKVTRAMFVFSAVTHIAMLTNYRDVPIVYLPSNVLGWLPLMSTTTGGYNFLFVSLVCDRTIQAIRG